MTMTEHLCTYSNQRGETLAGYLYDDLPADDRAAFERHLAACALCRTELDTLRGVRLDLAAWTPPEPKQLTFSPPWDQAPRRGWRAQLAEWPVWAQAAAAVLVVGVAAGAANLRVSYVAGDLTIGTGWLNQSAVRSNTVTGAADTPWRADIAALEQELRGAIDARQNAPRQAPASLAPTLLTQPTAAGAAKAADSGAATAAPATTSDAETMRRLRALVRESETRQQRELALRIAELAREIQNQRQADLVRIDRSLGVMQNQTGIEVMRTQRQLNSLAQQVSQRP
jgi:hypothetical protein